jgi:hypothetical protein
MYVCRMHLEKIVALHIYVDISFGNYVLTSGYFDI